jgi:hypothetical protein
MPYNESRRYFWCHAEHMSLAEMAVLVPALVCWQCLYDLFHGSVCVTTVVAVLVLLLS